jgi:hypothetical protein
MINMDKVMHVYPAVLIPMEDNEMGQVSLEWLDTQNKIEHEISGYIIAFLYHDDIPKEEFYYPSREALEEGIDKLQQLID